MAALLLAALGNEDQETDAQTIRTNAGALLFAEALVDLKSIRNLLTPKG